DDDSDFSTGSVLSEEDSNLDLKFQVKVVINVSESEPIPQNVSYKINGCGQAMTLDNKNDYNTFISEYQKLENSSKSM
ncbi:15009_t:CDS:2, partial [Racocetra fulgida]